MCRGPYEDACLAKAEVAQGTWAPVKWHLLVALLLVFDLLSHWKLLEITSNRAFSGAVAGSEPGGEPNLEAELRLDAGWRFLEAFSGQNWRARHRFGLRRVLRTGFK